MPEILTTPANRWFELHVWDTEPAICMTPIERALWHDLRAVGLVMYPQIPIGPYFADFANPRASVVIECDGKRWHDPEKDAHRDGYMAANGWKVYRFTGAKCMEMPAVEVDDNGLETERESALVVELRAIGKLHLINCRDEVAPA